MQHKPDLPHRTKQRVLNAVLSDKALTNARIAAFDSKMLFKDYLDQLLLQAKPINGTTSDQTIGDLSATVTPQEFQPE